MAYRVDISPPALADAESAYLWIKERAPEKAGEWYEGLLEAVFSLENLPTRCALAPESQEFSIEIRQLLYGKRGSVYRILFGVSYDPETQENVVRIYRIRHSAQRNLKDLELFGEEEENQEGE